MQQTIQQKLTVQLGLEAVLQRIAVQNVLGAAIMLAADSDAEAVAEAVLK